MIISDSAVFLSAHHQHKEKREVRESVQLWVDRPVSQIAGGRAAPGDQVTLSEQSRTAPVAEIESNKSMLQRDFRLEVLRLLIERLTGRKIDVLSAQDLEKDCQCDAGRQESTQPSSAAPDERSGWGLIYDYSETYIELETTSFNASGIIRTADGREISFATELTMSRSFFSETHINLRAGDALKDPLVINFGAHTAALSDGRFAFDLDLDGQLDTLARLRPGSGFLALDRNGDGVINNGTELFGPRSGDGFAELRAYDHDNNGWIDEKDPIFGDLRVWIVDSSDKDRLVPLGEIGIGALYLNSVATPFQHKNLQGELLGVTRSSSIHLHENGTLGTIQHLDLVV